MVMSFQVDIRIKIDIKHTYHDDRTSESFWWGALFNQSSEKLVFCSYAIIFFQCHNPDESMFQKNTHQFMMTGLLESVAGEKEEDPPRLLRFLTFLSLDLFC